MILYLQTLWPAMSLGDIGPIMILIFLWVVGCLMVVSALACLLDGEDRGGQDAFHLLFALVMMLIYLGLTDQWKWDMDRRIAHHTQRLAGEKIWCR